VARGQDSARNPRRTVSPAIRDAIRSQQARRSYLFGDDYTHSAVEDSLSKMDTVNQVEALVNMTNATTQDLSSFMQRTPAEPSRHDDHGESAPKSEPQPPAYGMTLAEYRARNSGTRSRVRGPSSSDPFPLGKVAGYDENPSAAWKRKAAGQNTPGVDEPGVDEPFISSSPAVNDAIQAQSARRASRRDKTIDDDRPYKFEQGPKM
jgi:hypothetical protein